MIGLIDHNTQFKENYEFFFNKKRPSQKMFMKIEKKESLFIKKDEQLGLTKKKENMPKIFE